MATSAADTVFLVDDDSDFRESMQWLLESANLKVSAYDSAQAFLDAYPGTPGCLLIDVRMPEISGLALQQQLRSRGIDLPTIIMTGHGDIPMAVSAMKNGALDFLEKPFDDEVMLQQVQQALALASQQQQARAQDDQLLACYASLSRREKEVMSHVVQGLANREIAETLGISPKTVEVHRARVMHKMQANNLAELVQLAARLPV